MAANSSSDGVQTAEVVLPCTNLAQTLPFFTDRLGFRLTAIFPADDPTVAVITGYGVRLRLETGAAGGPGCLHLRCHDPAAIADGATELMAPNGTLVRLAHADPPLELPPLRPAFVLNKLAHDTPWIVGRAEMRYRDLVPDRQGGRFIASHIQILCGGTVPDYVHFHRVRFQLIYCFKGWVRVVYEDQGPPFVLQAGDCVLQPPGIRHRVLESSLGLEVIEVSSPARHETHADHELVLPTRAVRPDRVFGGQRFVRHERVNAEWLPHRIPGFEARGTGIGAATNGLGGARVVRRTDAGGPAPSTFSHGAEFLFQFVLAGTATLRVEGQSEENLAAGDSYCVPAGARVGLSGCSPDLELLEVSLPAEVEVSLSE